MKTKSLVKLIVAMMLCLAVVFAFVGCRDHKKMDNDDDNDSQPNISSEDNNIKDDGTGDIYLPNGAPNGNSSDNTSPDDFTNNFDNGNLDTDNDGIINKDDPDDDNDKIPDIEDPDDDNDQVPDNEDQYPGENDSEKPEKEPEEEKPDEEKPDYGNQGPLVYS